MATTVDTLGVRLEADMRPLQAALRRAQQSVQRSTQKMSQSFNRLGTSVAGVGKRLSRLRAGPLAAVAVSMGALAFGVQRTSAEMQDLQMSLNTVFKGMDEGEAAMAFIQEFAQRTPYDIQTLSRAMIQLAGAGIAPTEELLTTFGDAAAATTDKIGAFEAMVRIATRSVGGGLGLEELEQLVTAGIPVYQILQEEIGVTRNEISELGQTAEGAGKIMDALQRGLNKNFGGGMERASRNLSVAFSNLGIAANNVLLALGSGTAGIGLNSGLTVLYNGLSKVMVIIKPLAHALGFILGGALQVVGTIIDKVAAGILMLARAGLDLALWARDFLPDSLQVATEGLEELDRTLTDLENQMNRNISAGEDTADALGKPIENAATASAAALKDLRAKLAGYNQAQIDLLKESGFWENMDFSGGLTSGIITSFTEDMPDELRRALADLNLNEIIAEGLQGRIDANEAFGGLSEQLNAELQILRETAEGTGRSFEEMISGLGLTPEQIDYLRQLHTEITSLKDAEEAASEARKLSNQRLEEAKQIAESYAPEVRNLQKEHDLLTAAMGRMDGATRKLATDALEQIKEKMRELDPMYKTLKDATISMSQSLSQSFADALVNGKNAMDGLKNVFKQFVATMIAKAMELFVFNHILNAVFGLSGGSALPTRTLFAATGGNLQANQPTIVGERGPELIVPRGGGNTIVNSNNTRSALSGGSPVVVNQTINVDAGVSQTVRAEMMTLMPVFREQTVAAVADQARRGGSYANSFR